MKWYNISLMLRKEREGRVVCDEMACGHDEQ